MQPNVSLHPLVDAVYAATGRRPHLSTALRWCFKGISGTRLESWKVGGRRLTTIDAVNAFVDATTAASSIAAPTIAPTGRHAASAHNAAIRSLEAEGL